MIFHGYVELWKGNLKAKKLQGDEWKCWTSQPTEVFLWPVTRKKLALKIPTKEGMYKKGIWWLAPHFNVRLKSEVIIKTISWAVIIAERYQVDFSRYDVSMWMWAAFLQQLVRQWQYGQAKSHATLSCWSRSKMRKKYWEYQELHILSCGMDKVKLWHGAVRNPSTLELSHWQYDLYLHCVSSIAPSWSKKVTFRMSMVSFWQEETIDHSNPLGA